ncbi:DUF1963 domain-containing protein [Leptolyngbya sp. FACHB-321]|uniref:YwqG family protein n=1 Tax=Leptolyngbya sp. FACHB-321 TaxID=2692807 RepID=UPI0016877E41|nr:YwqG family protein [Leptolyngbya sp. FACHB-321]MBD2034262.1 DUF1963 domain-containing protein [Leptolyngbya sp. FACHB-321]
MTYKLENLGTGSALRQRLEEDLSTAEIEALESTIQPFIEIDVVPSQSSQAPTVGQSRLGGFPDLPVGFEYPRLKGKPAVLLAQINFAEVPSLEEFPETGLLQFYLADQPLQEFDYRFDLHQQNDAAALFFPAPLDDFIPQTHNRPQSNNPFIPTHHTLQFERKLAPAASSDTEFADLTIALEDFEFFGENYETALGELADSDDKNLITALNLLRGGGHKLSGYPGFLQGDPRHDIFPRTDWDPDEPFELLLRLISTRDVNVAGFHLYFLIKRSDLLRRDFSKVVFYFDR